MTDTSPAFAEKKGTNESMKTLFILKARTVSLPSNIDLYIYL